jgi:NAD(P)H-hydrate repair Nnr-like enzyme with NAD(P)H-hydrate dehydratase domain
VPTENDHKYSRGVLGVVAGTRTYPGAAILVCGAAVRAGVGMVRYLGDVGPAVVAAHPEVVAGDGQVQAWTLGPGVDAHDEAQAARIATALASGLPAVVDAGALPVLPERVGPHVVLTPHAGELVKLLAARGVAARREDVVAEPLAFARRAHELTGATVLLKGAVTLVVGPGDVLAQADAPAWLATAGAGDVLAGLLGALLAARSAAVLADPSLAARLAAVAATVHGLAARTATPGGPVSASAVANALPATVAGLLR